jgi:hypothetical protein
MKKKASKLVPGDVFTFARLGARAQAGYFVISVIRYPTEFEEEMTDCLVFEVSLLKSVLFSEVSSMYMSSSTDLYLCARRV